MNILLKNITILPMTGENFIIEKGYLIIDGQYIKEIGEMEPAVSKDSFDKVIDGTNQVVLPGFINTHTHAAMTLLRGYADDLPLKEWLENKIWPLEARLTGDDCYWGTMLAALEMIRSGTTTFCDMYFFMDKVAQAVKESGMRAVLAKGLISLSANADQILDEGAQLASDWHKQADERITVMLGPHAPYTCSPEFLTQVGKAAEQLGIGVHIHLAETKGEFDDIMSSYGKTPVGLVYETGLLERPVVAAHCVHLTSDDLDILKKTGVGVAHNPESNMKLASGVAPVPALLERGVPVGLGTDGASSNNNLDMLQEMRTCALLHKVTQMNPTVIPAYQALAMATVNGARVLRRENELGQLKPGYKADMIILNLNGPHMIPRYDILANIVYAAHAGDVDTVIVNGQILMEKKIIKVVDEAMVLENAKRTAQRLVKGC